MNYTSETIGEIAKALAVAQGEMANAPLNKVNPHFKSRYADLAAIRDAVVPHLSKQGVAVAQIVRPTDDGRLTLVTRLMHSSGEWIESMYPLPTGGKPQEFGSAMTYAKRYSLAAIAGISADDDDDGNAAQTMRTDPPAPKAKVQEIAPPPSKEEADNKHKAGMLRDALRAATDAEMVAGIWDANADFVAKLPQATQAFLVGVRNEVLDKFEPEDTEEPEAARYLRAG